MLTMPHSPAKPSAMNDSVCASPPPAKPMPKIVTSMSTFARSPTTGTMPCFRKLKSLRETNALNAMKQVMAYRTSVPKFEARVMPVSATTESVPTIPMIAETTTISPTAQCGVAYLPWRRPSRLGISASCATAYVTRTPVFIADRVVPRIASATVTATTMASGNPNPPSIESPIWRMRSPIGALEAAAASSPVTDEPSAAVAVSLVDSAKPAEKYSMTYAKRPWMTSARMTARGTSRFAFMASAPNAVADSNPTRMRMAMVDWASMPIRLCGRTTEAASAWTNVALSGLRTRYATATTENSTSVTSCTTLMTRAVVVEPVTPRTATNPTTIAKSPATAS